MENKLPKLEYPQGMYLNSLELAGRLPPWKKYDKLHLIELVRTAAMGASVNDLFKIIDSEDFYLNTLYLLYRVNPDGYEIVVKHTKTNGSANQD